MKFWAKFVGSPRPTWTTHLVHPWMLLTSGSGGAQMWIAHFCECSDLVDYLDGHQMVYEITVFVKIAKFVDMSS
jgi:hypothetical protein